MNPKTKTYIGVAVVAAGLAGAVIGNRMSVEPTKNKVRAVLYDQCVNSAAYAPDSDNKGDSLHCNRRSIDLLVALIYNDSYMPPFGDVGKYEAALDSFKRRN